MTYHGHVENGVVVIDTPEPLPEGSKVIVEIQPAHYPIDIHPDVRRFSGILPKDLDYRKEYYEGQAQKHR